jgi:hypothetical protein
MFIRDDAKLTKTVQKCDHKTRSSFDVVVAFVGTEDYKMLLRIRNNVSFHYPDKLAVKALEQIDRIFPHHRFTYALGHDPLDWYFELGDMVIDRMVVWDRCRDVAPLHRAVRTRWPAAVKALLDSGADARAANGKDSTPILQSSLQRRILAAAAPDW